MPRISNVYFCSIPELDINYNHTVNFKNITNQVNWFLSKSKYSMTDCTYLRKERSLTIDKYIDDCMIYNYCLWNNGKRWEYFFIINKEYVTENSTKLTLKLDVLQTYYFNINFAKIESYVEREHCYRFDNNGDVQLDNLLEPEDIEVGELKAQEIYNAYDYSNKGCYFLTSSTRLGMINGGSSGGGSTGGSTGSQSTLYKEGYCSGNGLYFIKQSEGFSATPYNLGDGTYTIGYGTTSKYDSAHYNQLAPECTEQQASEVLGESLYNNYSKYVHDTFVSYGFDLNNMKQNEFDAFVSFYYNTGSLTSKSIFTKYINGDSKESIAETWKTTVIMVGTQFEEGLRNRRAAEANVFLNADYNYKEIPNLNGGTITDNNGMGYIPPPYNRQEPTTSTIRENVVASARKLLGKPYVYGGNYPPLGSDNGTDCSGLCQWAYNDNGISISRTTFTQINDGHEVTYDELKMGDLVFTRGKTDNGHVVMFISKNSDGSLHVIEAKQTGTNIMENDRTPNDNYRYRSIIND